MTSRADEIQKLIADIDNLLASSGKRLSRLLSSQAQEPREVLQRIRGFLVRLGENERLRASIQSNLLNSHYHLYWRDLLSRGNNQYASEPQPLDQGAEYLLRRTIKK